MKLHITLALGLAAGAVALVHADLAGPPPGHTGAPGEQTCATAGCHEGADQAPAPRMRIITFYTYDDTVFIRVILSPGDAGFPSGHIGFQAVLVDPSGQPIGSLNSTDTARYRIDTGASGRIYISQSEAGGSFDPPISTGISYQFEWDRSSAPDDSAMLYVSALWSNTDSTRFGDAQATDSLRFWPCPVTRNGDVNLSGSITSADIIYLVHYIFNGGPTPLPCEAAGDVNCTVSITTADIIHMVNMAFKSELPCDVCPLIWDGVWACE